MKIGILTRRYGHNMGSTLQAYAMSELVRSLGHDAEIIDYDESSAHLTWKIRPLVEHLQWHLHLYKGATNKEYLAHRMAQEKCFADFERRYLPLSSERAASARVLRRMSSRYDKIVVGSDQIWSPFLFDPNYFGAFLEENERAKLVPYAPSVGTSDAGVFSEQEISLLRSLAHLSCREEAGAAIISEFTGREVPTVLDPTLMLPAEAWQSVSSNHIVPALPEKYVLTYFLGKDIPHDAISSIAADCKAKVVNVAMFNKPNGVIADVHARQVGPGEFLALVGGASHALTDSFHATIFSHIFNRPFTVFERFKASERQNQNSRIHTLLSVLGKQSCLYGSNVCDADSTFELQKQRSLDYLKAALL